MKNFRLELKSGLIICSELSETEVAELPDTDKRDMNNGYIWYSLPPVEISGQRIIFSLCFFCSKLQSVNVAIVNPELYGSNWNDFSEEKEKLRAKDTEKWLMNIGYKTGKYSWGEIWAGFDSKGGFGHAVVRYSL
ncbi:hypothetical protein [Pseudomonas mangrovi]|uniref:hypothetical protein n=1 Tax=Pseudomonas mangrovi TaxID=2161748 RepID=UPI0011B21512|nr:hypothetical protein [Pseudomonas mangrovi]